MFRKLQLFIVPIVALLTGPAVAQQAGVDSLPWQESGSQPIAGKATIAISKGVIALDTNATQDFLRMTENTPEPGAVTIAGPETGWFAVLNYEETGHIEDDEEIDADALLETMKSNQEAANEEKASLGFSKLFVDGWSAPPRYNPATKNLEWGLRLHDEAGNQLINFTTRTLGREGLIASTLVTSDVNFNKDLASFRTAMQGLQFDKGQTYADFREGDKVAEYGLAALVAGGAAAAVAKSGAFKGLFKLILAGIAAFGVAIAAFFRRLFGSRNAE